MLASVPQFAETSSLLRRAELLQAACQATQAAVRRGRLRNPIRRLYSLSHGASGDPVPVRDQRCPHCSSEVTRAAGYVLASGGLIYERQHCDTCDKPFLIVRQAIRTMKARAAVPHPSES